jgi:TIR domain
MTKVFVSYSHKQGAWVWERLVPVLRAGGTELLLDKERFKAGLGLPGQMDGTQDQADMHVLCLSSDYYGSAACQHEMQRALALDPDFVRGIVIPVRLDDAPLPVAITAPDPLWVDMRKDRDPDPWQQLLMPCGADLGVAAPVWLNARHDIVRYLGRGQSVNLVVHNDGVRWRELIRHLKDEHYPQLACVDLENPSTIPREGLLDTILQALGARERVRRTPNDLPDFARTLAPYTAPLRIAVSHFDLAPYRRGYGVDLFSTLRHLVTEERRIVLLIQSRTPFAALLPRSNPLSKIDIHEVALA